MDNSTTVVASLKKVRRRGRSPRKVRRRGRFLQIRIYLGKLLRGFVYQSDWKVFPMAVVIASMFTMVVKRDFFLTMEGTLKGALGFACIGIWNGCFNSIQVICRERPIIKREHRSGMHISSYIWAHMVYQAILCAGQTVLTIAVCSLLGVSFPSEGFITPWFMADIFISMFLLTFAADMLSLLVSAVVHSTTAAMTVMPFILIFQLVFAGGFFNLPGWSKPLSKVALSNYGLRVIAAQANYNELPLAAGWNTLNNVKDQEISFDFTIGEAVDLLSKTDSEPVTNLRATEIGTTGVTVGMLLAAIPESTDPLVRQALATTVPIRFKLRDIFSIVGTDTVKASVQSFTSRAAQNDNYALTEENILSCWGALAGYALLYALIATVLLEFIDKDKR